MLKIFKQVPQFELATFFIQTFWLSLSFLIFFLVYVKVILPSLFFSVKFRGKIKALLANTNNNIHKNFLFQKYFKLFK